jgi:hypothetical protein
MRLNWGSNINNVIVVHEPKEKVFKEEKKTFFSGEKLFLGPNFHLFFSSHQKIRDQS